MTVTLMLSVPTLLVASPVPVARDTLEMALPVKVRSTILTHTCDPISSVSLVTGTGEATRSVGTGSVSVAVAIIRRSTLI